MNEDELKRIHGEDVELDRDDSEDERLTEAAALAQAKEQGIEFEDFFSVDGDEDNETFKTRKEAEAKAYDLGLDRLSIIQTRRVKK